MFYCEFQKNIKILLFMSSLAAPIICTLSTSCFVESLVVEIFRAEPSRSGAVWSGVWILALKIFGSIGHYIALSDGHSN